MTVKALPNRFLVCCVHLRRCHTNSAVKRVVRSTKSCSTSTDRTDCFFVKERHIQVFKVLLKRSTMLAIVSSLCVAKWSTPFSLSNFCNALFKNSDPLSVCKLVIGALLPSNSAKAATRDTADMFFSGIHQARFENTPITVSRNAVPSFVFFSRDTSTRSAHRLTCLWRVYVSCSDNQRSTSWSGAIRRNAATPP